MVSKLKKKIDFVVRLQHWMDSVPGQTFLNYAYSWGAAIVILGALFKLTHLPGGDIMLFLGMGTEVVVFFLSAFDRPFDKNEIGKELPADYETDEQIAARMGLTDEEEGGVVIAGAAGNVQGTTIIGSGAAGSSQGPAIVGGGGGGGTVIIGNVGGGVAAEGAGISVAATAPQEPREPLSIPHDADAEQLAAIIRTANDELLHRAQAVLSPEMEEATQVYIEKLKLLTETFEKVDMQTARLAHDSEEMENLNRTLTGINKVYELHLKSISLQVGTIDHINEQTHKLAEQIEELNLVYGRMIQALTVNMRGANPAPEAPASNS